MHRKWYEEPLMWLAMLIICAFITEAVAGDVTVSWLAPEGSEVCSDDPTPADVAEYRIFQLVATIPNPTSLSHVFSGLEPGSYSYISTSVRSDGAESRISDVVEKTVTEFVVTDTTVYIVVKTRNQMLLVPGGTIPLGTPCDITQSVNGKYAVPSDQVTWSGTSDPVVVVAQCG